MGKGLWFVLVLYNSPVLTKVGLWVNRLRAILSTGEPISHNAMRVRAIPPTSDTLHIPPVILLLPQLYIAIVNNSLEVVVWLKWLTVPSFLRQGEYAT